MSSDEQEKPPPYAAEYARSNRAGCKACKQKIDKDTLRLAARWQVPNETYWSYAWHHFECFWNGKRKFPEEKSFVGFESLTEEDKERMRAHFKTEGKETESDFVVKGPVPKLEYAKSNGKCFNCKEKIDEGSIRVSFKVGFYHPACFESQNVYDGPLESFDGFKSIEEDDQKELKNIFKKSAAGSSKRKAADSPGGSKAPAKKKEKVAKDNTDEKPAKKSKAAKESSQKRQKKQKAQE
jgi:hypothetical protein